MQSRRNRRAAVRFFRKLLKRQGCVPRRQQTFVDTYAKWAAAKLYPAKTALTAADLLNDRILPDRGTEFCGRHDEHPDQLFLAVNDIAHTKPKVKSPQTTGIGERFHTTVLQAFYQVAFRKTLYGSLDELQQDLDAWLVT